MEDDEIPPRILVVEANALITAASHTTDDKRYGQLMAWAREIIAPLVAADFPDALWLESALIDHARERFTDEEFNRRFLKAVRKAAESGSVAGKFRLACELDEDGTREESARLFAEAAEAGHAHAKWCHGLNLVSGSGIEKDAARGNAFIRESADQKFEGAIEFIVEAYALGIHGYPQDPAESARWRKN